MTGDNARSASPIKQILDDLDSFFEIASVDDEVSIDNWAKKLAGSSKVESVCHVIKNCANEECPAYKSEGGRCWLQVGTLCDCGIQKDFSNKIKFCTKCEVYKEHIGGDIVKNVRELTFALIQNLHSQKQLLKEKVQEYQDVLNTHNAERSKEQFKAKEKFRKYIDIAAVMLIALNSEGEITLINQEGCKLLKTSEEEALGKNWFEDFLPQRRLSEVKRAFTKLMEGGEHLIKYSESPIVNSNGEERIISFKHTILTDKEGNINGVLFSGDDITMRKENESELERQRHRLGEVNIALDVLLQQASKAKQKLEKNTIANIMNLINPHVIKLETIVTDKQAKVFLDIIKSNLNKITASFSRNINIKFPSLTPREIQVVDFIRHGLTNKDIAKLLHLSPRTIETYRDNIRVKLKIKNKRINLRSFLLENQQPH